MWGQHKSDFSQHLPETSNGAFCVSYAESSLTCKFELNTAILDFYRFEVSKSPIFTTRPGELKWCVLCYLRWGQPYLQIWAQYGDFKFPPIWGQHKSDFSQIVPDNSNSAFFASYAEGSLTLKFELNTTILDFNRFEVSKNPIFHKSSRRPQLVRFVLVTLRAALPANLSSIRRF